MERFQVGDYVELTDRNALDPAIGRVIGLLRRTDRVEYIVSFGPAGTHIFSNSELDRC